MCCFSSRVRHVGATRIFARLSERGTQLLAYQMHFQADDPVAMILPLPIARRGGNALRFINLRAYPDFFDDLGKVFPLPATRGGRARAVSELAVESVGDYEASFVASVADFGRLAPQFRLPSPVWQNLPQYKDYGFAVFQLQPDVRLQTVHPMAFEFLTALNDQVFFPTVHIHDGKVHPREKFDHTLYLQTNRKVGGPWAWRKGPLAVGDGIDLQRAQSVATADQPAYKVTLRNELPNRDILVRLS